MTSFSKGFRENDETPHYNVRLIYVRNNRSGEQLYIDPSNQWVVKIEYAPFEPKTYNWVLFQGDKCVSEKGIVYLLTSFFEDMKPQGFVFFERAHTKFSKEVPDLSGVHGNC